jgi:hypothetical protein
MLASLASCGRPSVSPRTAHIRNDRESIGCVIVPDGAIIGEGYNKVHIRHDPTSHRDRRDAARRGEAPAIRVPRSYALLELTAPRQVHDGVDLGQDRTHRLSGGA